VLDGKDVTPIARYLIDTRDPQITEPPAPSADQRLAAFKRIAPGDDAAGFQKLPADGQWTDLGKRLVVAKNCTACHTIAPDKKPLPEAAAKVDWPAIQAEKSLTQGCLSDTAAPHGTAP